MKIGPLPGQPFYRMHTPRWAVMPTSGAGAAKHGGRFNRPGVYTEQLGPTDVLHAVDPRGDLDFR
jgi:hypothetical protein